MASSIPSKIFVFVTCSTIAYTYFCFQTWLETGRWGGTYLNNPDHCKIRPKAEKEDFKFGLNKEQRMSANMQNNVGGIKGKLPGKQEEALVTPLKEILFDSNTVTVLGIIIFLMILVLNAVLDTIQAAEVVKANENKNTTGEQKQSLSEFANKKTLRRESTKFSLNLGQISESATGSDETEDKDIRRKPYNRGDSAQSYLSDMKTKQELSAPTPEAAKPIGSRPVSMVRRSSFPTLPKNPEVQALKLGHRQPSNDSDDESDGKGRRVRIIRRF